MGSALAQAASGEVCDGERTCASGGCCARCCALENSGISMEARLGVCVRVPCKVQGLTAQEMQGLHIGSTVVPSPSGEAR
eukprot:1158407-Pelagomonas_calceolata.AAC.7